MTVELSVDGAAGIVVGLDDLAEQLACLRNRDFVELWLSDRVASICFLKSGHRVLLMFLASPGDSGSTSRSAAGLRESGNLPFHLANGQVDEHPAAWTVPFDEACRAVEYFWSAKAPAPFISWAEQTSLGL